MLRSCSTDVRAPWATAAGPQATAQTQGRAFCPSTRALVHCVLHKTEGRPEWSVARAVSHGGRHQTRAEVGV